MYQPIANESLIMSELLLVDLVLKSLLWQLALLLSAFTPSCGIKKPVWMPACGNFILFDRWSREHLWRICEATGKHLKNIWGLGFHEKPGASSDVVCVIEVRRCLTAATRMFDRLVCTCYAALKLIVSWYINTSPIDKLTILLYRTSLVTRTYRSMTNNDHILW